MASLMAHLNQLVVQVELLGLISPHMASHRAKEIEQILASAPYNDEPTKAVNRMRRPHAI
jgi:hypothetical protein